MDEAALLSERAPLNAPLVDIEPIWKRVLPLCAIFTTTLLSIGVDSLQSTAYLDESWLYAWSLHSRASLQVVTFLVATVLGAMWAYAVCTTINFESRLYLRRRVRTLPWLKTVVALSQKRIDWALPTRSMLVTVLFLSLSTVPTALWTGALTAQAATANFTASLAVPLTGDGAYSFRDNPNFTCRLYPQANGTFSLCPHQHYLGQLLQSVRSATTFNSTKLRQHPKFDYTKYQYAGRSYGVGSSVGLTDTDWTLARHSQSYTYQEQGFQSKANCIYNTSAVWRITAAVITTESGLPDIFRVSGFYPNSNWTAIYGANFASANASGADFSNFPDHAWYATIAFETSDKIVGLGSHKNAGQSFVNIVAGASYSALDRIQCELIFTPTTFNVNVSIVDGNITVTPVSGPPPSDPDPQERLRASFTDAGGVQGLSQIGTSLWTSMVGDSLLANVANAQVRAGLPLNAPPTHATVLAAVADSLEAVLDDLSMALGAASLLFPNNTMITPALVTRAAVRLGSAEYGAALLAVNALALLAVLATAVRTRLWRGLPAFDHADWPSLAAAAARGGARAGAGAVKGWRGAGSDAVLGTVRAHLQPAADDGEQLCLVLR